MSCRIIEYMALLSLFYSLPIFVTARLSVQMSEWSCFQELRACQMKFQTRPTRSSHFSDSSVTFADRHGWGSFKQRSVGTYTHRQTIISIASLSTGHFFFQLSRPQFGSLHLSCPFMARSCSQRLP